MVSVAGGVLVPHSGEIAGAMDRRGAEAGEAGRLLEGLLGIELPPARIEEGRLFCAAVAGEVGTEGLNRMWEALDSFPTREELSRPAGWTERMSRTPPGGVFGGSAGE